MQSDMEKTLEIFNKAIETEREGIKIYEEAVVKVKDIKAREVFKMLAEAERKHLSSLEDAKEADRYWYSSHELKGKFSSEISKEIEAIDRQYIPNLTDNILSVSALDAINMGIKIEQDSIAFYTDAMSKVTDLGVANLLSSILSTERMHLFILELGKDYRVLARLYENK